MLQQCNRVQRVLKREEVQSTATRHIATLASLVAAEPVPSRALSHRDHKQRVAPAVLQPWLVRATTQTIEMASVRSEQVTEREEEEEEEEEFYTSETEQA